MKSFGQIGLVLVLAILGCATALGQAKLGPYVVDSTGQSVGYTTNSTEVLILINGSLYAVAASRDGFWALNFSFSYSEPDCAGTEYLDQGSPTDPKPMFSRAWFTTDGVLHYSL